jgi:hypothetical protein
MSVAEIIQGLTKPQRLALLSGRRFGVVHGNWPLANALLGKQLVSGTGRFNLKLTELGAQVADALAHPPPSLEQLQALAASSRPGAKAAQQAIRLATLRGLAVALGRPLPEALAR